jgi:hypothetical protein
MVKLMQKGNTIMLQLHCKTLKKLCRAIQNKRHGVLLHDNACLYTDACTRALLEHFSWELFDHLFTHLKNWLRSQCFRNNEKLMEGVKTWLSSQVVDLNIIILFSFTRGCFLSCPRISEIQEMTHCVYTYCHFINLQLQTHFIFN